MKSIRNSLFSMSLVLLIGQTCVKDSEENLNEDESYVESMYGQKKEVVEADWNKFISLANRMISVSESNLKTLRINADQAGNSDLKIKRNIAHQKGEYQLTQLKGKLQRRNLEFKDELNDYDGSSGKTNTEFKNDWLNKIVELNTVVEDAIDE